jgi:hypothetical protein
MSSKRIYSKMNEDLVDDNVLDLVYQVHETMYQWSLVERALLDLKQGLAEWAPVVENLTETTTDWTRIRAFSTLRKINWLLEVVNHALETQEYDDQDIDSIVILLDQLTAIIPEAAHYSHLFQQFQ